MQLLDVQNNINTLIATFVAQVKGSTAMGRTDINHISESVLIPLFEEMFGYSELKNLNYTEEANYPGIDLGDEKARVAFQITSTATTEKVKNTLQKFVDYELYKKYDRLIIYILTEKQKSYSGSGYEQIIQGRFTFDKERDILDYRDLLNRLETFEIDQVRRIENILEAHLGKDTIAVWGKVYKPQTETVFLNLIELSFPDTLYVADLYLDDDEMNKKHKSYKRKSQWNPTPRDLVRSTLAQSGLRFGVDWVCYEDKLITFHDLYDGTLPLSEVIDGGTIDPITPKEFYDINEDQERVFKSLLGRCLQQKLYHQNVHWQHEEKLFIFSEVDGQEKRYISWHGKKENRREVYRREMKKNKPEDVFYCKHAAFRTQYKRFGDQWYLVIKPEWFFSRDGYTRSFYNAEKVDWLKKHEWNPQVFNLLRLIASFLQEDKQEDLFEDSHAYPFLSFGNFVNFDSAPFLPDDEWLPKEAEEKKRQIREAQQIALPLEI